MPFAAYNLTVAKFVGGVHDTEDGALAAALADNDSAHPTHGEQPYEHEIREV